MTTIAQQIQAKAGEQRNGDNSARLLTDRNTARTAVQRTQKRNDRFDGQQRQDSRARYDNRRPQPTNQPRLMADGVDHINLWSSAKTELGRVLAIEHAHYLRVKKYGNFSSVLSLFVFLTTKGHPDRLRRAPTRALTKWVSDRRACDMEVDFPNVEFICAEAIADVIQKSEPLRAALIASNGIHIDAYREQNSYIRRTRRDEWWASTIRLIRSQLIAEQPLDMTPLLTSGDPADAYIDLVFEKPEIGRVEGYEPRHARQSEGTRPQRDRRQAPQQQQRPRRQVGNPGDFEAPPAQYFIVFASEELRQGGLEQLKSLNKDELLGVLSGATPGVPVEATVPEPTGEEQFHHGVSLMVASDGTLVEINGSVWFGPEENVAADAAEAGADAKAVSVLHVDGTGILVSDGREVLVVSEGGRQGKSLGELVAEALGREDEVVAKDEHAADVSGTEADRGLRVEVLPADRLPGGEGQTPEVLPSPMYVTLVYGSAEHRRRVLAELSQREDLGDFFAGMYDGEVRKVTDPEATGEQCYAFALNLWVADHREIVGSSLTEVVPEDEQVAIAPATDLHQDQASAVDVVYDGVDEVGEEAVGDTDSPVPASADQLSALSERFGK